MVLDHLLFSAIILYLAVQNFSISYNEIKTMIGKEATIMCNITIPKNDNILLIRWFKGDVNGVPFYTIDGRHTQSILDGEHFKSADYVNRVFVETGKELPYLLTIKPVREQDDGLYFCRVDLKWTRTIIESMRLYVITPPNKLTITSPNGIPFRKTAGPFNEDETAILKCVAISGKPLPHLEWYESGQLLDATYEFINSSNSVENTLSLHNLQRSHLYKAITCRANHQEYPAVEETVLLEMNLKPVSVKISVENVVLKDGEKYNFMCTTSGSRPPAIISWRLEEQTLPYSSETYSQDGNQTFSTLELQTTKQMNGKVLVCRAENNKIPTSMVQDEVKLNVEFPPKCKQGQRVAYPASIGELIDITCLLEANPPPETIWWGHLEHLTSSNNPSGQSVGMESKTLDLNEKANSVLKVNVESRSDFKSYWCKAQNSMGSLEFPCVFSILPQDPPSQLDSCSISVTNKGLKIECTLQNASPPALYHILEVYEDERNHLLHQINSSGLPVFELDQINSDTSYVMLAYSVNQIGRSKQLVLTLKGNKSAPIPLHISDPKVSAAQVPVSPMFGALSVLLIVSIGIMIVVCLLIILMVRRKISQTSLLPTSSSRPNVGPSTDSEAAAAADPTTPDVIPTHGFEYEITSKVILLDSTKQSTEDLLGFTNVSLENVEPCTLDVLTVKFNDNVAIGNTVESFRSTPV